MKTKILIFFLLVVSYNYSMEKIASDLFPQELIVEIARCFNKVIGTTSWVNEADLPVIVNNIKSFSLVNKRLYNILNNHDHIQAIIYSLAQRFNFSPEEVVAKLNTPGANSWLENKLKNSADYTLFKVVQRIFALTNVINKQSKSSNKSILYDHQSKKGLLIIIHDYAAKLLTPWGKITIEFDQNSTKRFQGAQELFKHMSVGFETFISDEAYVDDLEFKNSLKYSRVSKEIRNQKDCDYYEEIQDITLYKRKSDILLCDYYELGALYKIHKIDDEILEEAVFLENYKDESYNADKTIKIWELLNKIYAKENGTYNERKNYKKPNSIVINCSICSQKINKELTLITSCCKSITHQNCRFHLLNNQSVCSLCSQKFSKTAKLEEKALYPDRLNAIPKLCRYLAQKVDHKPVFNGKTTTNPAGLEKTSNLPTGKILPVDDWINRNIMFFMSSAANYIIPEKNRWGTIFIPDKEIYTPDRVSLGHCILLSNDYHIKPCSLDTLENTYQTIIDKIKNGWEAAKLENYPTMSYLKSEEEYTLFVKDGGSPLELDLINSFALKFQVDLTCYKNWTQSNKNDLYLWVKKDSLEKFHDRFDFHFKKS